MIKVDDKLLCKKDYMFFNEGKIFSTGKYYLVYKVENNRVYLYSDDSSGYWFNTDNSNTYYLYDYFCDKKEERKFKLNKLNNDSEILEGSYK